MDPTKEGWGIFKSEWDFTILPPIMELKLESECKRTPPSKFRFIPSSPFFIHLNQNHNFRKRLFGISEGDGGGEGNAGGMMMNSGSSGGQMMMGPLNFGQEEQMMNTPTIIVNGQQISLDESSMFWQGMG